MEDSKLEFTIESTFGNLRDNKEYVKSVTKERVM